MAQTRRDMLPSCSTRRMTPRKYGVKVSYPDGRGNAGRNVRDLLGFPLKSCWVITPTSGRHFSHRCTRPGLRPEPKMSCATVATSACRRCKHVFTNSTDEKEH